MKLYLKNKLFSLHQKINITDENETLVYQVSSKVMTIHDTTVIHDDNDNEIANIHRRPISIHNLYTVDMAGGFSFQLSTELFHIMEDIIRIDALGWQLRGRIMEHDYDIIDMEGNVIASTHKKWISLHESYEIDVIDEEKTDLVVAVFVVLEHILTGRQESRASSSNAYNASHSNQPQ